MGMLLKIELHGVIVSRLGIRGICKWCSDRDVAGSLTNMHRLRRYGLWADASYCRNACDFHRCINSVMAKTLSGICGCVGMRGDDG